MESLLEQPEAKPRKPEPVQLKSAHDYGLVTQALELRKDDLKKLATKTIAEGYTREGGVMNADAMALEHHVLPAFRNQRELPLVTPEQLQKNVAASLKPFIWKAFDNLGDPKVVVTYDGITGRRERLHEVLSQRIMLYVIEVADEAYRQGMAAREQTPEAIADRMISILKARDE